MRFRIAAAVVALAVVVGIVAIFNWSSHETRRLVDQLNARYVEKIEIENVARAGGGRKDLILIDGLARYDCSEEAAGLRAPTTPPHPGVARSPVAAVGQGLEVKPAHPIRPSATHRSSRCGRTCP